MTISPKTLTQWLVRSVSGAICVQLKTQTSSDGNEHRIVASYDLVRGANKEELENLAKEILATAQDEANISQQRMSFLVCTLAADERMLFSMRLRCEYVEGNPDPEDAPNRDGLLGLAMRNLEFAYRELGASPKKQRDVYENLIEVLQKDNAALRAEIKELHRLLSKQHVIEAEELVAREKEAERKAVILERAVGGALELARAFIGAGEDGTTEGGQAPGPNGGMHQ